MKKKLLLFFILLSTIGLNGMDEGQNHKRQKTSDIPVQFSDVPDNKFYNVVKDLIAADKVNYQDNKGRTALMHAAYNGYQSIVELLFKNKANLDLQDAEGNTALMLAIIGVSTCNDPFIYKSYEDTIKFIIDNHANLNIKNKQGLTALDIVMGKAAFKDESSYSYRIYKVILQKQKEYEVLSLFQNKLILDVNLLNVFGKTQDRNGDTILHKVFNKFTERGLFTTRYIQTTLFQYLTNLLNSGYDLNIQNNKGQTVLMLLMEKGNCILTELIDFIIENKIQINFNIQDKDGKTFMMYIPRDKYLKIDFLRKLSSLGVDLMIEDNNGKTYFDYTNNQVTKGKIIEFKMLKKKNMDLLLSQSIPIKDLTSIVLDYIDYSS